MTNDPGFYLTMAASGLTGLTIVTAAGLSGWRGWLTLKQQELSALNPPPAAAPPNSAGSRIEIADLKERIRKLEAIAAGVDL